VSPRLPGRTSSRLGVLPVAPIYWDEDRPEWAAEGRNYAAAWRNRAKWVVSRSLKSVGPNATLAENDIEAVIRRLNAQLTGEMEVAGPELAGSLTDLGLIDEYRLYLRPFVLGRGNPYFALARPPLHLVATDAIGEWLATIRFAGRIALVGDVTGLPQVKCY
jgi:dihydrofolate reductase